MTVEHTSVERPITAPPHRQRVGAAIAIGLASMVFTVIALRQGLSDYAVWWTATRLWLSGIDPYQMSPGTAEQPLIGHLFYPLPALLLTVPLVWLPMPIAGGLTMGLAAGVLVWLLTCDGWGRLWLFASPSYVMALKFGQWSPLLCIATLMPVAGWLAAAKPTLGLAVLTYRLQWRAFLFAGALLTGSVLLMPGWPRAWLANLAFVEKHPAPIATLAGCWLALALLRWRRPEARLLLAMASVPQLLFFADQLPIYLIARSRGEAAALALPGLLALGAWYAQLTPGALYVQEASPYVLAGVYGPAMVLLLLRPNVGEIPRNMERFAARLPHVLRGAGEA